MSESSLQRDWVKAAKQHIQANPSIYGRNTPLPGDEVYFNFIDRKIIQVLNSKNLKLGEGNIFTPPMKAFLNAVLDKSIEAEQGSDVSSPINRNAKLKIAVSLQNVLNEGFEI